MNKKNFYSEPIIYRALRPVILPVFKLLFRPKIIGSENIPKDGSIVLAGNHTKFWDCFMVIAGTKRCVHFLAKNELFSNAVTKWFFTSAGIIRVYRNGKDRDALESAKEYLREGCVVGIFPEGTTKKGGEFMLPFKIGAVKMAHDTDTAIVPFTINGKYKLFKKGVEIIFQKPFKIESDDLTQENDKLREKVLSEIRK